MPVTCYLCGVDVDSDQWRCEAEDTGGTRHFCCEAHYHYQVRIEEYHRVIIVTRLPGSGTLCPGQWAVTRSMGGILWPAETLPQVR